MNYVDVFGSNRKRTISTRFLLPMLAEKNEKFSDFGQAIYWNSYGRFINAFMAMKDKPYLDSHIFLMFRIDEFDDTYYKNLFFLTKNKYFIVSSSILMMKIHIIYLYLLYLTSTRKIIIVLKKEDIVNVALN